VAFTAVAATPFWLAVCEMRRLVGSAVADTLLFSVVMLLTTGQNFVEAD